MIAKKKRKARASGKARVSLESLTAAELERAVVRFHFADETSATLPASTVKWQLERQRTWVAMASQIRVLRAMLSEIGPPEKISDGYVRQCVVMAAKLFNSIAEDVVASDTDLKLFKFVRRQILHAYDRTMVLEALAAREKSHRVRSEGGKTTALARKIERDARIEDIRRIAAELRKVHGDIKDEALAGFIVERRGLREGVVATRKLLNAKKSTEK